MPQPTFFYGTLLLFHLETAELYQVSFHILILSGQREKTLMEKVSLSLRLSALWETRPSPHLLLSCGVFWAPGPHDRKSVRPVSDVNLHPSMTDDSAERPGEHRAIDRHCFKETDEPKEQGGSHTSPPSLHPCKPPLALKNRTSLNCATWCLYHSVGAVVVVCVSELRHRRAINSAPTSVLFSCIRKLQAGCHCTLPRQRNTGNADNEGTHTHTYTRHQGAHTHLENT